MTYHRPRWSDNDHTFGPLLYSRDDERYRPIAVVLRSGDGEEYPGASFRISAFGHTFIAALPQWVLKPYRYKVFPNSWDAATIQRLGRNWYWQHYERKFGFTISDGHLSVMFGRQAGDSSIDQRWGWFFPWTQWRHVRRSFYNLEGGHFFTLPDGTTKLGFLEAWQREQEKIATVPRRCFEFDDYDGERITATTMIEEREWRFGTGAFRWLSSFRAPKIKRSLDIDFSAEVGERKGSWKGGTLGHGIEMNEFELHESAFKRYCNLHSMTFVGEVPCRVD